MFLQRMQPIMMYLLLPLTEKATDTAMVEGHLPPDFMSSTRNKRIFYRFHPKWGKGGVFLQNILKITC